MAEKANDQLVKMIAERGAPDATIDFFNVPENEKAGLLGAESACRHIAERTARTTRGAFFRISGRRVVVCEDCQKHMGPLTAKAGK